MRRRGTAKLVILFLTVSFLVSAVGVKASSAVRSSARASVLYQPDTDSFIYKNNENERLPMASTTKVMTALVAAESLPLDKTVTVPIEAVGVEGSSAYLKEGERITVEGLLFALLLRSANDAAVALAHAVSGSIEAFALLMNEKAESLSITDTRFVNPHGLDHEEHYTTAHDLAIITAAALKNETVARIASTKTAKVTTNFTDHFFINHNKLLWMYDGACGVKTGFTRTSGRCLVGAARRNGVTLITVTLDATGDWQEHMRLFDLGFSQLENRRIAAAKDHTYRIPVIGSDRESVTVCLTEDLYAVMKKDASEPRVEVHLSRYATAPIKEGDEIGEVVCKDGDRVVARGKLVAESDANLKKQKNFLGRLKDIFT